MNISLYSKTYNEIVANMQNAYRGNDMARYKELARQAADVARRILAMPGVAETLREFYRGELKTLSSIISGNVNRPSGASSAPAEKVQAEQEAAPQPQEPELSLEEAMAKLNELIGLEGVKKNVFGIMNRLSLFQEQKKRGFPVPVINYHMVFTGNPGTGKTTVARLIAQMYRALGVVKKGHLVEVQRKDLVAEYEGQTAVKTAKVIESAMGGILFIDEAYDLVRKGGSDPFGMEAVNTLLPLMENRRGEFVVVVAGYKNEMKEFLSSNPGFVSRFNSMIEFEDYTEDELLKIFMLQCKKNEYNLTKEAGKKLKSLLADIYKNRIATFSNARQMRIMFEDMLMIHGTRLSENAASLANLSDEELMTFDVDDVPSDYSDYIGEGKK